MCGEGGEYETLVLDCPLFQHACIQLDALDVQHLSAGGHGAVAILHPTQYHLEPKGPSGSRAASVPEAARASECSRDRPQIFKQAPATPSGDEVIWVPSDSDAQLPKPSAQESGEAVSSGVEVAVQASASGVHVSCTPRLPSTDGTTTVGERVQRALHAALDAIQRGDAPFRSAVFPRHFSQSIYYVIERLTYASYAVLDSHGLSLASALFVHLYLARMEDFGAANSAYGHHFPAVNPPARACVQAQLPPGVNVMVDVLSAQGALTYPCPLLILKFDLSVIENLACVR